MLQRISREIARFFVDYDVLLTPTLAEPPLPLGTLESPPDNPLYGLIRAAAYVPFTPICNITGQPAMSVPLYWNADGLPIGTHFVGALRRRGDAVPSGGAARSRRGRGRTVVRRCGPARQPGTA